MNFLLIASAHGWRTLNIFVKKRDSGLVILINNISKSIYEEQKLRDTHNKAVMMWR